MERLRELQQAIELAENFIQGEEIWPNVLNSHANTASEAATKGIGFAAASACYAAASTRAGHDTSDIVSHAADAVDSAASTSPDSMILSAFDADLTRLASMEAREQEITIDPGEQGALGPLWPEGNPDWYVNGWNNWNNLLSAG